MCDCYQAKCEKCDIFFPIHLSDWAIEREDIQVFCRKHLPRKNVAVHRVIGRCYGLPNFRGGVKVGFRFKRELPVGYTYNSFCLNITNDTEIVVIGNPVIKEQP